MIDPKVPAIVLAPMDGITDAPMRELLSRVGCFSHAVSEFIRVSCMPLPPKVFSREVPELANAARTRSGMPVHVQILGGDPERLAISAQNAVAAGAKAIDINFGCPAPTVNRNDGGASLLRSPCRIRDIVQSVRAALPSDLPVSAKLRLGWDDVDDVHRNADMAAEGGASWLTLHARTKVQGYQPPVYWPHIGAVMARVGIPVIANGDIWTVDDFRRCRDETGCIHFMIGRGALANPNLSYEMASELGLPPGQIWDGDWVSLLGEFLKVNESFPDYAPIRALLRLKQWAKLANQFGQFPCFEAVKVARTVEEFFDALRRSSTSHSALLSS